MSKKYEPTVFKRNPSGVPFTEPEIEFLKAKVLTGISASDIAKAMNNENGSWPIRTRSAIIGFCHRNGLKLEKKGGGQSGPRKVVLKTPAQIVEERLARARVQAEWQLAKKRRAEHVDVRSIFEEEATAPVSTPALSLFKGSPEGVPIFSAPTYGVCRFIVDDTPLRQRICCEAAVKRADGIFGSWCAEHKAIVFQPTMSAEKRASKMKRLTRQVDWLTGAR